MKLLLDNKNANSAIPDNLSCDLFNDHFVSIGSKLTASSSHRKPEWKGPSCIYNFKFEPVSVEFVAGLLKDLPPQSKTDLINFDCKLLKVSSSIIAPYITMLINDSLKTGQVLSDWKKTRVTPIYKGKGSKDDVNSYRPISVLNNFAKILEKCVQVQLMNYLSNYCLLSPDQSAYLKNHSTQTALLKVTDQWYKNIDDGLITGVCFFDISKCFDSISHELLLFKLEKYGIRQRELDWFISYLTERQQCTSCNNQVSSLKQIITGVPQGSILGPVLFLLFINDLPMSVRKCNLYADDTEIEVTGNDINTVKLSLQSEIDKVNIWFKPNRLVVNASKCCSMLIGSRQKLGSTSTQTSLGLFLDNTEIENRSSYKYLGLHLDSNLKFDEMIDDICKKLRCRTALIQRVKHFLQSNHLCTLYYAFIQPFIDYCLLLWGHASNSNISRIQRFQNRSARIVTNVYDYSQAGISIVKNLEWLNVYERKEFLYCLMVHKSIYGSAPHYLSDQLTFLNDISNRETRQNDLNILHVPFTKSAYNQRSFSIYAPSCWNKLPPDIRSIANHDVFKKQCKKYILSLN